MSNLSLVVLLVGLLAQLEFGKFDFLGACRTMGIVKDGQFE